MSSKLKAKAGNIFTPSLFLIFALVLRFPFETCEGLDGGEARPNILVILVDDLGVMDTSVPFLADNAGIPARFPMNDRYRTPNLEKLAAQGVRFGNFLAMSVCSPTRVSIMTGQTSARHRTTNWIRPDGNNAGSFGPADWNWKGLGENDVSLPRILQRNGYRTIHVGKGHLGPWGSDGADPHNIGFDVSIGGTAMGQPGHYSAKKRFGNMGEGPTETGVPGFEKYYHSDMMLTQAESLEMQQEIARAVAEDQPFFGYLSHYAVHAPFYKDPRFAGHYATEPNQFAAFASLVEGVDDSLGQLLEFLEELGIAENTFVIFLGDNGSDAPLGDPLEVSCSAPLRGKKGTHYEGGMKTVFLASWAKVNLMNPLQRRLSINGGTLSTQIATVYDLFPTILAITGSSSGVPENHVIDGLDLSPWFTKPGRESVSRDFMMHFPHEHRSSYFTVFRRDNWKLVYHWRKSGKERFQLFNLDYDFQEQNNLSSEHPDRLGEMFDLMCRNLQEMEALPPLSDDRQTPLHPTIE